MISNIQIQQLAINDFSTLRINGDNNSTRLHSTTNEAQLTQKQVQVLISHKQQTHNRNYLKHRDDDKRDGDRTTRTVDDYKEQESTEMNDTLHSFL